MLKDSEIKLVDHHHRETLRRLMRLNERTPRSVIYFLAGSLPGVALLHLRQLTLFGMISRLSDNILLRHALNIFTYKTVPSSSWFHQIRNLCLQYGLPHPSELLFDPMPKETFKKLVTSKVVDFWEQTLRSEACLLSSIEHFNPHFYSLRSPHPIWTTAGSSPAKVSMATIQALMISGRYRTENLKKHWTTNKLGVCLISQSCSDTIEDIPHILSSCPALKEVRDKLLLYTVSYSQRLDSQSASVLIKFCNPAEPLFSNFLLDCSTFPEVIELKQGPCPDILSYLFDVTRTWVYTLHKARLVRLNQWRL